MAAPMRAKVLGIFNFPEGITSYYNVHLLKYITGNVRHVKRFGDSTNRVPEVEVPFSNG
jgi:hypothetical protein